MEKIRENSKQYKFKENWFMSTHAITLISLVITIILLIILAGIVINLSIGENGLFNKTKYAKEETNKQAATEKINLKITTAQINTYSERQEMPTLKELSLALKEDSEIQYVTETRRVASAEYDVKSENPSSIFTKLKEYPYEFEINGELQLASINGVKIAQNPNKDSSSMKVLYDGAMSEGTITFEENTIDDYDYYEFIFGVNDIGSGIARIFSQIISKEYLKITNTNGDLIYLNSPTAKDKSMVIFYISNTTNNTITINSDSAGSWEKSPRHIYKIIGRNM